MNFLTTTELMPHQVQAVAKLLPSKVGALFMEMGTGKSLALIRLAEIRQGKWDRLFWFCPVSVKETIFRQLLEHTTLTADDIAVWGDKISTAQLPADKRIHIIGLESISGSDRLYLAFRAMVTASSFVAVDESSFIKGHNSKRTLRITQASEIARYRTVLTGTPFTQGAVDLFAQMRFLSQRILGYRSFYSFARNHLEYLERKNAFGKLVKTTQVVRAHDVDVLAAKIAPYTYQVRKSECLTLPSKLYETRWCSMSVEQRELYERVKHHILVELGYEDWSAVRIFHLFTALQTVLCGWYTDPEKSVVEVEHNRLDTLLSAVAQIPEGEPVIIWAKYQRAVQQISAALADEYGPELVHQYYGQQTETERNASLAAWRAGGRFIVATQSTGGIGLTMNEAAYAVFYANSFKYSELLQAEDRNHRIGQNRATTYITIRCSNSIDDRIALAIGKKGSALSDFMAEVDDARNKGLKKRAVEIVKSL